MHELDLQPPSTSADAAVTSTATHSVSGSGRASRPHHLRSTFGTIVVVMSSCVGLALPIGAGSAGAASSPRSTAGPEALAPEALPTCGTDGTPNVVAVHGQQFYIDAAQGLDASYAGYTVRSGTTSEAGLWIELSEFRLFAPIRG